MGRGDHTGTLPGTILDAACAAGYNLALLIASPLLLAYLTYRLAWRGKSREGFRERLGWSPRLPVAPAGRVWLHAVSAGEMVAAAAVARRLRERAPEIELIVSATTPAGRQQAQRLIPWARAICYFPFDLLPCVMLALLRARPTVVACVESELWPNWLWVSRRCGLRPVLINGQFADRGYRGARRARWLYRWALAQLEALAMQSSQAAERALALGAERRRVRVVGNAKFDQPAAPPSPAAAASICAQVGVGRPLIVAGSTHPGEDEQVLAAYAECCQDEAARPGPALVIAPRHIERAAGVLAAAQAAGFRAARRSVPGEHAGADVVVLDTMGELAGLYALAQVVFVGGSLVPVGGHDILQPLQHGRATVFGPYMHNQRELARLSLEAGAALQVADAAELAAALRTILASAEEQARLAAAAARLLEDNAGAAASYAALLADLARCRPEAPARGPLAGSAA